MPSDPGPEEVDLSPKLDNIVGEIIGAAQFLRAVMSRRNPVGL